MLSELNLDESIFGDDWWVTKTEDWCGGFYVIYPAGVITDYLSLFVSLSILLATRSMTQWAVHVASQTCFCWWKWCFQGLEFDERESLKNFSITSIYGVICAQSSDYNNSLFNSSMEDLQSLHELAFVKQYAGMLVIFSMSCFPPRRKNTILARVFSQTIFTLMIFWNY